MIRHLLLVSFFSVFALAAQAEVPKEVAADLAEDFVPITEDFDGAKMRVFGALRSAKSDIAIVFEGPAARAMARPKVRTLGLWINGDPQKIEPVPSFYAVLSSQPLDKILNDAAIRKLNIGLSHLSLDGEAGEGIKQNRMAKGLYLEDGQGVRIRDKKLFRADLNLPPNVPVGEYKAMIYEIANGTMVASRQTTFKIAQIGVAGKIRYLAQKFEIFYGILSLLISLGIGGASAHLFRKVS